MKFTNVTNVKMFSKTYKILSNTLLKMKHIKVQHIQNKAEKISTVMMQSVIHLINCSKFKFTTNLHHRHFTPQNFNKFTTQALYTTKISRNFYNNTQLNESESES